MADEISDLRLFVRMVAAGSLSETARRLNSSLPAMSRRLAAMEGRLGVRLIDRSSRRFTLTEEGGLLYERGVALLEDLDEAEAEVSAKVKTPHGRLRVGAPLEIGRRRFAPLVARFVEQYPAIGVELVLADSRLDVIGDELDVGLQLDVPTDGSVISRRLISSRRIVCASPAYIARRGRPERPEDLLQHDCISLVRGRHVFNRWTFQEGGRRREVQVRGKLSTNNAEVLHGWTLMGQGIGLKALWDIEQDLADGRLVELLGPFACDEINLDVAYATRTHLPLRIRVFIDFIVEAMSRGDGELMP
ncbi:MAG: LysR substrate-binding domain-containing protein [Caulobacteraceae bacterium]|nr:LysR substrate-binding domain-containing protein [Caulobacteraceae bacterium]